MTNEEREMNKSIQKEMRRKYMDKEISFQEYYTWLAEFIRASFLQVPFTEEQIKASKDPYLNDLPMKIWDSRHPTIRGMAWRKGLPWSESDTCLCTQDSRPK